jgi:hypothetical protein
MAGKCGLSSIRHTINEKNIAVYWLSRLPRVRNSASSSDIISCFSSAPPGTRCNYMEQSIFLRSWWSYSSL